MRYTYKKTLFIPPLSYEYQHNHASTRLDRSGLNQNEKYIYLTLSDIITFAFSQHQANSYNRIVAFIINVQIPKQACQDFITFSHSRTI